MDCSYVLRKESWEENADLYQRLLISNKIKGIREYLANKKRTFIDNIIVSLPQDVSIYKKENGQEQILSHESLNDIFHI